MNFEFPTVNPKITKEFLLSKNSEETYMSTYLRIPVKKGLIVSPLRNDHKPTASFYRNRKGELIFHDFGTGFHGNFIAVVMEINKCTYNSALKIIAEDFNYVQKETYRDPIKIRTTETVITEKSETIIQIEKRDFTNFELKWWEGYGITKDTLKKFKVFSCESVFLNGNYYTTSTPRSMAFGYYGGIKNGNQLWRIYQPQKTSYRFINNWDKSIIQGAKQLPESGKWLVITKSLKDCLVLYELGIPAIAPCSELLFVSNAQLERIKARFKNIIVIYDNDLTGLQNMQKLRKKYPELKYFFIPRKYKAKDISDFCKLYGIERTKECANQLMKYYEK